MKHHAPAYDRAARLGDQIYRVVSESCYTELSDPRLTGIQITQVRMTRDMRIARVYFHLMDASNERIARAKAGLERAQGFFKRAIGAEIPMKFMPAFEFFYDETSDVHDHIEEIFADLKRTNK